MPVIDQRILDAQFKVYFDAIATVAGRAAGKRISLLDKGSKWLPGLHFLPEGAKDPLTAAIYAVSRGPVLIFMANSV